MPCMERLDGFCGHERCSLTSRRMTGIINSFEPTFIPPRGRSLRPTTCVDETLTIAGRGELWRALEAGRAFFEADIARLDILTAEEISRA